MNAAQRVSGPEPQSLTESVRQAVGLLAGESRSPWLIVLTLALVVAGMEAIGAGLVFTVIGLVVAPDSIVALPLIGTISIAEDERATVLLRLIVAVVAFFILRAAVVTGHIWWQYRTVHTTGVRLSGRLLDVYLDRPLQSHLQRNSADMIRNIYETVQLLLSQVFAPLVVIITETLVAGAMVTVLLVVQPTSTLFAVAVLGPLLVLIFRVLQPRLVQLGRESQDHSATMLQSLSETLEGIREIKVAEAERHFADRFLASRSAHATAQYRRYTLLETPRILVETVVVIFVLGLFGLTLGMQGDASETLAVLGLFGYAALRVMPSLNRVVTSLNSLRSGAAPIADVAADLPAGVAGREAHTPWAGGSPPTIELRDVAFRYDGAEESALDGVSTTIAPGAFVGLIGPTGGGKSTLLNVVAGLLAPTSGQVLVDGHAFDGRWGGRLGLVPQQVFLLDDTITANIAFGVAADEADEAHVWDCLAAAQVDDVVQALPDGLQTTVGEAGARLSGGQRQRLAIARALYRDPSVLVFDEGTSALDSETEAAVMDALAALQGDKTLVVVAHRLSTVAEADVVLLLRDGQVADSGRLTDLQARHPGLR